MAWNAADRLKHGLLRRMGLQAGPADPEDWVRVFSATMDNPKTGFSERASRIQQVLADAAIDAHQQPYVLPDHTLFYSVGGSVISRIEVAVVVRRRDQPEAERVLAAHDTWIDERTHQVLEDPAHDEELARLSLEAGERLKREPRNDS